MLTLDLISIRHSARVGGGGYSRTPNAPTRLDHCGAATDALSESCSEAVVFGSTLLAFDLTQAADSGASERSKP